MGSVVFIAVFSLTSVSFQQAAYDPGKTSGKVKMLDTEFVYGDDKRKVPLRIYLPESKSAAPVILFSHGLGGSKENNPYLGNHWAGRGYVVVFMQHAGSDKEIWKDVPLRDRFRKVKSAASQKNLEGRVGDVPATIDQLTKWNADGKKLAGRLNLKKIGMSGHSFGAVTTKALAGQNYGRRGQVFADTRIKAAVVMSPMFPRFGGNADTFRKVKVPWMLMTGTKDESMIGRGTPADRRKVFQQLPKSGHFYELVLHDAEHMAFSERTLQGVEHRNPRYHKSILAMSTAFWDTYLKEDKAAKKWLNGRQAKKVLEPKDSWKKK